MFVCVLCPVMSVHPACVPGMCEGGKSSDSLKLQLQMVESTLACVENSISVLWKSSHCFDSLIHLSSCSLLAFPLISNLYGSDQARERAAGVDNHKPLHLPINNLLFYHCIAYFFLSTHMDSAR